MADFGFAKHRRPHLQHFAVKRLQAGGSKQGEVIHAGGSLTNGSTTSTPNGSKCLRLRDRIISP